MKRILCAVDFTETLAEVVREADALAHGSTGVLAICHVVPDISRVHPLFPQQHFAEATGAAELERLARDALTERVRQLTGRGPTEFECFVEVGAGYPEILRRAETWRADVVVAGSRGRHGLGGMLLGSTASRIVRHAHCPVLIVRASAKRGSVVAATDLSDAALPALVAGASEATRRNAKLVVVHALDFSSTAALWAAGSPFGMMSAGISAETMTSVREAARITIEAALARFEMAAEVAIVEDEPAAAILREAEQRAAELVVVGTRGRTGFARVALGSVAEKVIEGAACSVLAVRLTPP